MDTGLTELRPLFQDHHAGVRDPEFPILMLQGLVRVLLSISSGILRADCAHGIFHTIRTELQLPFPVSHLQDVHMCAWWGQGGLLQGPPGCSPRVFGT